MNVANGSWNSVSTNARPISEFCCPRKLRSTYSGISSDAERHHEDRERQQEQQVLAPGT